MISQRTTLTLSQRLRSGLHLRSIIYYTYRLSSTSKSNSNSNTDSGKIETFFGRINQMTFLEFLFQWKSIKNLGYEAFGQFRQFEMKHVDLQSRSNGLEAQISGKRYELSQKEAEVNALKHQCKVLEESTNKLNLQLKHMSIEDERRKTEYNLAIAKFLQAKDYLDKEVARKHQDALTIKEKEFIEMKNQWRNHESHVSQSIRELCVKLRIEYVDNPETGNLKPDNTIRINDEIVVFDSKSPLDTNDHNNFNKYIKSQTEQFKKYADIGNVHKTLFMVIPSVSLVHVQQVAFDMGSYSVYVITRDALEPVMYFLKKVDVIKKGSDFDLDERDAIVRVLGRLRHGLKRKIQIDHSFAEEFIELLQKTHLDTPQSMRKNVNGTH